MYSGVLDNGTKVAVKRAAKDSMQGAEEFKTEIELLSRVHHKNLVGLVGYCYDQGEQMLVYEFMPNGTVSEWLRGKCWTYFSSLMDSVIFLCLKPYTHAHGFIPQARCRTL